MCWKKLQKKSVSFPCFQPCFPVWPFWHVINFREVNTSVWSCKIASFCIVYTSDVRKLKNLQDYFIRKSDKSAGCFYWKIRQICWMFYTKIRQICWMFYTKIRQICCMFYTKIRKIWRIFSTNWTFLTPMMGKIPEK